MDQGDFEEEVRELKLRFAVHSQSSGELGESGLRKCGDSVLAQSRLGRCYAWRLGAATRAIARRLDG
jgi:hypothetical protein